METGVGIGNGSPKKVVMKGVCRRAQRNVSGEVGVGIGNGSLAQGLQGAAFELENPLGF